MLIKHILFDLDGTLLPMNQDEFVNFYMPLLAKAYITGGVKVDPKEFIRAIWKGYNAMVQNDGTCTNYEVFWNSMDSLLPVEREKSEQLALAYYSGEFNQAIAATSPNPMADKIIKTAKEKGIYVYLATNPVFPRAATMNRIRWAGLDAEDFRIITTYEDNSFCKPNVKYFKTILDQFGLKPEECLMVGNDVEDDLAIRQLGVRTFLITDTMENKKNLPIETDYRGTMEELLEFVNGLECEERNAGTQEMMIRKATIGDLAAVTAVEAECFPAAEAADEKAFQGRLSSYPEHFWLLFDQEKMVGFVNGMVTDEPDLTDEMYEKADMHNPDGKWQMIFGVNTIPSYRRRGCAEKLLRQAIADAKEQGREGLVLTCKDKLVHYYAKFGFVNEGVSKSVHGGAVWYQMRLRFEK